MADLGFVRNEAARHLRSGRSSTLAYVMLDAGQPVLHRRRRRRRGGCARSRASRSTCATATTDADREAGHLAHLVEQRVQGILVTRSTPRLPDLAAVARRGTPVVVVDRTRATSLLCSVAVDDVLGGHLAVEHLLDRGHDTHRLRRRARVDRPGARPARRARARGSRRPGRRR